jgi:hypothetical protein
MQQLLSMAQDMARNMEEKLKSLQVEGNAGGGMVTVRMNGHKQILSLAIAKEAVDPEDVAMLEDLIVAAVNDAQAKVDAEVKSSLGPMAGRFPGGGLPNLGI